MSLSECGSLHLSSPWCPFPFPSLSLSCLRVLASEASPGWREQQDTRQETALDISLSYIYKVSQVAVSVPHPGPFHRPAPRVPPAPTGSAPLQALHGLPALTHGTLTPSTLPPEDRKVCTHLPAYLAPTQHGEGLTVRPLLPALSPRTVPTALVFSLFSSS